MLFMLFGSKVSNLCSPAEFERRGGVARFPSRAFVYFYNKSRRFNLYNVNKKQLKSFSNIVNDINNIPFDKYSFNYLDGNKLIISVPAIVFLKNKVVLNNPLKIENVNEADNPILLVVEFKKNI